jgi:hypothetical protein
MAAPPGYRRNTGDILLTKMSVAMRPDKEGQRYGWSGSFSSMFAAKLAPFEKLLKHPDVRLQRVGKIGFEQFSKLRDENLTHEKRAAVRGELL